eukprot:693256-Prorocentrum_minimum.AAC.32
MNPSLNLNLTSIQDAWGVSDLSHPTPTTQLLQEGEDASTDDHTYASILQFLKKHNLVLTTSPSHRVSDQSPFTEFWNWKPSNTPPDIVFFLIFTVLFLDKLASILKL